MALSKQDINLEDAIDIRELKNIKLANQLLKLKRKQKQEKENQMEMQKQQQQAQIPVPPIAGGEPPVPEESGFTGEGGGSAQAAEAAALAALQTQQPN